MADSQKNSRHPRMAVVLGVVLIVLGVFNLAGNVFPGDIWFRLGQIMHALWGIIWPSAFVVAGVHLVWASRRGKLAGFTSSRPRGPFRRSLEDRRFLGVCGGIAYYFGVDSTVVRIIAVILLVIAAPTVLLAYAVIAIVVPYA